MKKGILKKLSVLSIIGITLVSNSVYSNANKLELNNNENSQGTMKLSTDEEENLEIHNDFLRIFPEEMEQIDKLIKSKSNSNKSEQELLEETSELTPIIDTSKEVDDNYYRLVAYSNGVYYKLGVKDGTSTTGSGYVSYKGRKAYGQFYSAATNATIGHTFTSIISYTNVKGGYDIID